MANRQKYMRRGTEAALVAAGFFIFARLGSWAGLTGSTATPVWPASALAMVAVIGGRYWNLVGVAVGSFAGAIVSLTLPGALVVAAGDTVAAALAAAIFSFVNESKALAWFGGGRALTGYILSGTVAAATSLMLSTPALTGLYKIAPAKAAEMRLTWWLGDSLAVITLAPALYAFREWFAGRRVPSPRTGLRFALIIMVVAGVIALALTFPEHKGLCFLLFITLPFTQVWLGEKAIKMLVLITVGLLLLAVKYFGLSLCSGMPEEHRLVLAAFVVVFSLVGLNVSIDDPRGFRRSLPFLVLVGTSVLAAGLADWWGNSARVVSLERDEELFNLAVADIRERVEGCVAVGRQSGIFLGPAAPVDPQRFKLLAGGITKDRRIPGLVAVGIVQPLAEPRVADFVAECSRIGIPISALRPQEGSPAVTAGDHGVVTHFKSYRTRESAVGVDLFSDPKRRAILSDSLRTGRAKMMPRPLGRSTEGEPEIEIYIPVGHETDVKSGWGPGDSSVAYWIMAVIRTKTFVEATLAGRLKTIGLSIFQGPTQDPARLIFSNETGGAGATSGRILSQTSELMRGQIITLSWRGDSSIDATQQRLYSMLVLLSVVFGGALVSGRMISMREAGRSAEQLVQERTGELKAANAELQVQKRYSDRMALIVQKSNSSVAILDRELRIEWVNDAFVRMTGFSLEEIKGCKPKDLFTGSNNSESRTAEIGANFRKCVPFHFEDVAYRKDGATLWVHVAVQPFFDGDGTLLNYAGIIIDLTEQKRFEEEMLEAKRRAESANRAKGTLIANVSHELRTPLNVVMGNLQLLANGGLAPAARGQISKSLESCRYLLRLITDLLDVNQAGAGRLKLEIGPVVITELCDEMLGLVQPAAAAKSITLVCECRSTIREVACDRLRIKQVVINLLGNAVKYTPYGGQITLRVEDTSAPPELFVRVIDSGIGIDPADFERIFEEFEQLPQGGVTEGRGLGLPIARRLAELHGGSLGVESALGAGSTFTLRLPIRTAVSASASLPAPASPNVLATRMDAKEALILVVDDMPDNREILTFFLKAEGYQVAEAGGGEETLARVASLRPQLILMDVRMGGIDGLETIRRLKARPDTKDIPVVSITAFAGTSDIEACLAAGAAGYVSKPIDFAELGRVIGIGLGGRV